MKEAFGCATLRTGTLIIGWLGLVGAILQLMHVLAVAMERENDPSYKGPYDTPESHHINDQRGQDGVFMLARALVPFFFYGTLVYGAYMKRRAFLIPFMIAQLIVVVGIGITIIYLMVLLPATFLGILIFLLALALNAYCLCIVWNYYNELKSGPPVPVIVVQKSPA